MRFLALTVLAVCLVQGLHAQPQNLRERARERASNVAARAGNVVNAATDVANRAGARISSAAQNVIDRASNLSREQIVNYMKSLTAEDILSTIEGSANKVDDIVESILDRVGGVIEKVEDRAVAGLTKATANLNPELKAALDRAGAVGADVHHCAAETVLNLGRSASTEVVKCATNRVREAVTLTRKVADLPVRAKNLHSDGKSGFETCNAKGNFVSKNVCKATSLVPIGVQSVQLVKDASNYYTQAAAMYASITAQIEVCAYAVAAKKSVEATRLSIKVTACLTDKIREKTDGRFGNGRLGTMVSALGGRLADNIDAAVRD